MSEKFEYIPTFPSRAGSHFRCKAAILGVLLFVPGVAFAVQTEYLAHGDFGDFLEGEFENVALSSSGELVLAPAAERVTRPDDPIIWTAVPAPEGGFYLGTGNKGKVYRLSPEGDLDAVFEPDQVLSRALAIDGDGTLYVGTSPEGRVYRISPEGEAEVYFEPEQNYIWDLVFDDDGDLFVATGAAGNIYRLAAGYEPGDAADLFFESGQTHISTLARDAEGRLLAGTSPGGFVYRFDRDGSAFAILNTGDEEVRRIVPGRDGALFVATFAGEAAGAAAPARPTGNIANVISAILGAGDDGDESPQQAQRRAAAERVGTIYRIDAEGFSEPYWAIPGYAIHSMAVMPDGRLLVGTGNQGRIFSVSEPGHWTLLQGLETGGEVSVILPGAENDGEVYVLTSNPAQVYRMDFGLASQGHFTSKVLDVEQVARWGRFHLEGSGEGIRVATRSGNTEEPEQTWSDWRDPVTVTGSEPLRIESPSARYFQYRVYLEGDGNAETLSGGPRVDRVRFFYRKFNVAPEVTAVKRVPAEVALERVPASPQPPSIDLDQLFARNNQGQRSQNRQERGGQLRVQERPGLATLAWQASDPNDDRLSFTLKIRAADEEYWTTLAEDLEENFFSFNTEGFGEGRYYAKVIASDHLSNPPGTARTASRTSDAFLVDNTAPAIEVLDREIGTDGVRLRLRVEDAVSIIRNARYSLNGGERTPLFPVDGIFDSRRETFLIEVGDLDPGQHSVLVVAEDEAGNERVRPVHFEIGD